MKIVQLDVSQVVPYQEATCEPTPERTAEGLLSTPFDEVLRNRREMAKQALSGVASREVHGGSWGSSRILVIWAEVSRSQRPEARNHDRLTRRILLACPMFCTSEELV